ncbi:MAG: xghA [Chloroflexi bacterium]|nr:xghA [Chloroflexota bacterium]
MSGQRRMYVGVESGAVVLAERDGHWEQETTLLEGRSVHALRVAKMKGLMYAGLDDGVYVSGDSGRSWDRTFEYGNSTLWTLDADPLRPETAYIGLDPVQLYRSRDAGDSWEEVEALRRQPESVRQNWWFPVYPHDGHVKYLHVDPRDGDRIYLAIEHGGIMRTDDGGRTWEDLCDGFENLDLHFVMTHPTQENVVYACGARGVHRSEDFGHDWVRTEDGGSYDNTGGFAISPGQRATFYMTASRGTPPAWTRPTGAESSVFRSNDDGLTWHLLTGLPSYIKTEYGGLMVDPVDPDRVYVHGDAKIWGTADRGDTWSVLFESDTVAELFAVEAA